MKEVVFRKPLCVGYVVGPMLKVTVVKGFINKYRGSIPRPWLLCHPSG